MPGPGVWRCFLKRFVLSLWREGWSLVWSWMDGDAVNLLIPQGNASINDGRGSVPWILTALVLCWLLWRCSDTSTVPVQIITLNPVCHWRSKQCHCLFSENSSPAAGTHHQEVSWEALVCHYTVHSPSGLYKQLHCRELWDGVPSPDHQ